MPDVTAGSIYGAWGMLIVLYGVLGGAAIDAVGVRGCLLFSAATTGAARALLAITRSKGLALFCFFVPAAIGGALGVPVLTIGVKRCAPPHARGFAFSLFYVAMNLAALVALLLRDVFLVHVPLTPKEKPPPGLRAYMGLGAAAAALQILVVVFFVKSGKWQEEDEEEGSSAAARATTTTTTTGVPSSAAAAVAGEGSVGSVSGVNLLPRGGTRSSASFDGVSVVSNDGGFAAAPPETAVAPANDDEDDSASVSTQQQHHRRRGRRFSSSFLSPSALSSLARSSWLAATATLRAGPELYKFVAMSVLTVNLKSIFRHLDATLPKFVARAFGCSAPAGSIYSINPAMIMTLVPLVGAALSWLEPFDAIHYGGYVSAASPLAIVAAPTLGGTAGFVALLSIGEAVWSPRWYDYSMSVAPNGREGLFTALASAPLFLAQLPTGALSGAPAPEILRGQRSLSQHEEAQGRGGPRAAPAAGKLRRQGHVGGHLRDDVHDPVRDPAAAAVAAAEAGSVGVGRDVSEGHRRRLFCQGRGRRRRRRRRSR